MRLQLSHFSAGFCLRMWKGPAFSIITCDSHASAVTSTYRIPPAAGAARCGAPYMQVDEEAKLAPRTRRNATSVLHADIAQAGTIRSGRGNERCLRNRLDAREGD